jgi:hypothetical protein
VSEFENAVEISEEEMVEFIHAKMREDVDKAIIIEVLTWEFEFLKLKGVVES